MNAVRKHGTKDIFLHWIWVLRIAVNVGNYNVSVGDYYIKQADAEKAGGTVETITMRC